MPALPFDGRCSVEVLPVRGGDFLFWVWVRFTVTVSACLFLPFLGGRFRCSDGIVRSLFTIPGDYDWN